MSLLLPHLGLALSILRDSASTCDANQDIAGPSHPVGTELSTASFFVLQDVDSETLHQIYIPKWNVTNDSALDDPNIYRGVIDHLAPPALFSQLRSMDYEQLFAEFNVGTACQSCLGSEAEAAEAIRLRGQVAIIEAAEAARASELNGLKERNAVLEGQVAALESAAATKDSELVPSNIHIAKLTQDLSNLQLSCDALSIKASSLEFEKDKLVDQVSKLEGTCSELRDEVSDVANARVQRLKRNVASQHLSISDALVPLIEPLSAKNLVGEVSTSGVPATATTTTLSTPFIQASTVPPVPVTDHEVSM
ncbi:hypothetical protein Tco_1550905 [Tanacetum coccineum]